MNPRQAHPAAAAAPSAGDHNTQRAPHGDAAATLAISATVPAELLEEIAARAAQLALTQLKSRPVDSPWLDLKGAMAYLGFSRHRLYKLTAAHAIPHRKKRGGQGLLFHRDELDEWLKSRYPRQS